MSKHATLLVHGIACTWWGTEDQAAVQGLAKEWCQARGEEPNWLPSKEESTVNLRESSERGSSDG